MYRWSSKPVRRVDAAATHGDRAKQQRVDRGVPLSEKRKRMPDTGYFAEADPKAELRNPGGFVSNFDVTKRPGRYQSDFIWNSNWQEQLDQEAAADLARRKAREAVSDKPQGGLGLARRLDLDSMDVDLSQQLKHKVDPFAALRSSNPQLSEKSNSQIKPFQAESRRWTRSGKFASRSAPPQLEAEEEKQLQAEEIDQYNRMKQDLQLWTLAVSVFGAVFLWSSYSKEAAISYCIGAVGSMMYLRMLHRSVDSVAGEGLGGALGQPRLLIPVVLALGYNKWNQLKAEEFGLVLQLLPMLLGFFTYKAAVFGKQGAILLGDLSKSVSGKENLT